MDDIFTIPVRRCKQCGRLLLSKGSIERGYGCQCAKKVTLSEQTKKPIEGQIYLQGFFSESEEQNAEVFNG